MKNFNIVIIGGGVISLCTALYLSRSGYTVAIIEKNNNVGSGASNPKSNSSVIHAGIYYKKNSLKSKLCLRGKKLLYNFCSKNNIKFNKCGKIIFVKSQKDIHMLDKCNLRAKSNGLFDLKFLNKSKLKKIEPNLNAYAGLFSPSSGVLDTAKYIQTLKNIINKQNVKIFTSFDLLIKKLNKNEWNIINLKNGLEIKTNIIINASGLNSPEISKQTIKKKETPKTLPVLGYYLIYKKKNFLNHINYSALEPGIITERVDATPMMSGNLLFGPSVEKFYKKKMTSYSPQKIMQRYLPIINNNYPKISIKNIIPYSYGIRPKIKFKGKRYDDFFFKFYKKKNWLDVLGIDSPGLTASLAIGEYLNNIINRNYERSV
tara:strand:- start:632 stop:1753 length:1122 start_codon:yes stop_codon:yes gene_type:complete